MTLQGFADGFFQRRAALRIFFDEVRDDFGVGFGDETCGLRAELLLQFEIIFDDAVVDDDDFAGAVAMRVRVFFRGAAVRGPARVADAVDAFEGRLRGWTSSRLRSLPGRAADFQFAVLADDGDARGIVAAIFEALQAVEDERHDLFRADVADNSAHDGFSSWKPP